MLHKQSHHRLAQAFIFAVVLLASSLTLGTAQAQGEIADQLQAALDANVASTQTQFPGAILYLSHPQQGTWVGAAGVTDIETGTQLSPDSRFRAGSTIKPFIATVVLQLVEKGTLSLDDAMTEMLPEEVTSRFTDSDEITLRMLLNHTSGIPEWISPEVIERIGANPEKVWEVGEFLDLASAQLATFPPGGGWSYSNTGYNLLGVIIEQATDQSWRKDVRERVIEPLDLDHTSLPEPGDIAIEGAFMHGYGIFGGEVMDLSFIDPSMAGAAGGGALVTTVTDLAEFMVALRAGVLFENPGTFGEMANFVDATYIGGQVGYGLGLQRSVLPGGLELIGHAGGTAGYTSFIGFFPQLELSIALAISDQSDPMPVILSALEVVAPEFVAQAIALEAPAAKNVYQDPEVASA